MEFFNVVMDKIADITTQKRVGDRVLSIGVDGYLCTEVLYKNEGYTIFIGKTKDIKRSDLRKEPKETKPKETKSDARRTVYRG